MKRNSSSPRTDKNDTKKSTSSNFLFLSVRFGGNLESIPADFGQEGGHTVGRSPVISGLTQRRAFTPAGSLAEPVDLACMPNWAQKEIYSASRFKSRIVLLCGNSEYTTQHSIFTAIVLW